MTIQVLIPLPQQGFDPSEVAVPWKILTERNFKVVFSSPSGGRSHADQIMVDGKALKILGPMLRADENARQAYTELMACGALEQTVPFSSVRTKDFEALVLPGGHAKEMIPYLENELLQSHVAEFFQMQKLVGTICHGAIVAARSRVPGSERSVLYGRKVTVLPKWMELSAWAMTCSWMGSYYRTYPETVESEVKRHLRHPSDYVAGPRSLRRDSVSRLDLGFVVRDQNLITARWPGDVHRFGVEIADALRARTASSSIART